MIRNPGSPAGNPHAPIRVADLQAPHEHEPRTIDWPAPSARDPMVSNGPAEETAGPDLIKR
jgi:hypothetical protein